ncbi:septin-5 isoform X1 [Ailuropoda melanoleuca]|uniref:Septin 5 n=1 Tax=Ailuropoda melanoleuca TaxID=9646 RepID=A0A7N5KLT6_AILME|nr:septin-5 isoform X1 [Ailuropoda melanoleuca]
MFGPALRSSFPVAPPAAQFPGDCFPATARVGRSCPPHPPPAPARPRLWFWCGSGACLWLQRRGRLGAGRQRHGTHGLRGRRHPGWATSLLWASVPGPVKRGREPGFKAEPRVSPSCKPGPCGPDRVWGANAAMDSLAAPQDRLVEQLLSPRTQAQRRLKDIDKQYVGFATLPNQVHRKSVKKGFDFTLMVAGESGLGKSTLVHSLFLTDLYKDRKLLSAEERISQTVEILKHTVDIEEKGVKLKLTIVDTPGFGDAVNNSECWKPITDYVDQQFEQYFRDESGLNRKNIQDNRVHCCLYFISPFGHGLRPVDVGFMKALHEKVNIVPLIAKADCLVPGEIRKLKERIREEIDKFGIHVYQFPECDSDEDEDFKQQDRELKESAPFAVIGSNTVVEAKGQRVRGRLYPWGIVEVENQAHCDFVKLRNMLIRTHMHDLKDVTCDVHYENYRAHCIQQMTSKLTQDSRMESPIPILPLPTPDAETEKLIRMKDEELKRMQEILQKMKQQMQDQ